MTFGRRGWLLAVAFAAAAVSAFALYETFTAPRAAREAVLAPPLAYGTPVVIARVIDGDTVELQGGARLRYIGMDTPEEFKPNTPVQCYAKEAAEKNRALVEGKTVTIYKDVSAVDIYGRYLGFVYLSDGTFVNELLVRDGFAFAFPYKPDTSKSSLFAADQKNAKAAGVGLWGACKPYQESNGRWQTNAI